MDAMCRAGMQFASSVLGYVMHVHHSRDTGLEGQGTRRDVIDIDAKARVDWMAEVLGYDREGSIPILPADILYPQCALGRGAEGVVELAKVFDVALCVKSCKGARGLRSPDSPLPAMYQHGVSAAIACISLLDPTA